jgi:hypothetical protein
MIKWPTRYFAGLSKSMKKSREKELIKRRKTGLFRLGPSNKAAKPRRSRWTGLFHKVYPDLKFKKTNISKKTGIPKKTLNTVYNRGRRAWQTSGSRPGVTADQWGVARVYKYVLVTKGLAPKAWYAKRPDPNQDLRQRRLR